MKKFKALDNIRNTQVGHIQIDYRIACAMMNFNHKPCCPDKDKLEKIARKLKKRFKIKKNQLEFLLTKHLNTKTIPEVSLEKIDDFPKLSPKRIKNNIFLGSFQLKECKKYLNAIIQNGKAYFVSNQIKNKIEIENIKEHKLIAIEITSRHKRSEYKESQSFKTNDTKRFKNNYKVFILYEPGKLSTKAIKSKNLNLITKKCIHDIIFFMIYFRIHL